MRNIGLLVLAALVGCGGASSTASDDTSSGGETTTTTTTTTTTEHIAWDDMTHEQRGHFMAEVVMPAMQPLFQSHDAERFADFSCATCHGANAHEVDFHMPNGVHPLDHAAIMATFQSSDPDAVWMTQQVYPRMAQVIGEPQFDPATSEGFRCTNCHEEIAEAH